MMSSLRQEEVAVVSMLSLVQLWQNNGTRAAAEVPVPVPPDHLLCVPGQRSHHQPAAALHSTPVAGQQAGGPQDQHQAGLLHLQP